MALLRPCARLIRRISRTPARCQLKPPAKSPTNPRQRGYTALLQTPDEALESHLVILSSRLQELQVPYDHLLTALRLYSTLDAGESAGLLLLSCCGEVLPSVPLSTRQKLTRDVWNLLTKKCDLSLEHYHAFLTVCAQNRQQIDPEKFLEAMKVPATEATYVHLLNVAGKTGDLAASRFILTRMKELGIALSPEALVSIVEVYWTRGDVRAAEDTLSSIVASGMQPETQIYASLACGYASRGDVASALKLVESHEFSDKQLIDVAKYLCTSGAVDDAVKVLGKLPKQRLVEDPAFVGAMVELLSSGKLDALTVVKHCVKGLDNIQVCKLLTFVLKPLVSRKIDVQFILQEFTELKSVHEFHNKHTKRILLSLLEESLRTSYVQLSLALLRELRREDVEVRPHYFWPLFVRISEEKGEAGVFEVINEMSSLGVQLDHDTLLEYVLPSISTADPQLTLRKFASTTVRMSTVLTALVCYLLGRKLPSKAVKLHRSSQLRLDFIRVVEPLVQYFEESRDVNGCAEILALAPDDRDYAGMFLTRALGKAEIDEQLLKSFVEAFRKRRIDISRATCDYFLESLYNKTFDACDHVVKTIVSERATELNPDRVAHIAHPRHMVLEDLECHLVELKSRNLNPRGVLRRLFNEYCKVGDLKRVEEVKNEFEDLGERLTPGMKSHLFELYAKKGKVVELCEIVLDLQNNHPDFPIDDFKILAAAKALVEHGRVEVALELVENNGRASRPANRPAWELLDALARGPSADFVDRAFDLLTRRGLCVVDTTNLGPLIRPYLLRGDLRSAVVKFEQIYELHRKTPLKLELMECLVGAKAADPTSNADELLRRVVRCVAEVHGSAAVNRNLIYAYAKHGMMEELTDVLKKVEHLDVAVKEFPRNYGNEMKLKVFSNILEASRGMEHINRELLYRGLLTIHCEMNNYLGVVDLWTALQSDITPSVPLKKSFIRILSWFSTKGQ